MVYHSSFPLQLVYVMHLMLLRTLQLDSFINMKSIIIIYVIGMVTGCDTFPLKFIHGDEMTVYKLSKILNLKVITSIRYLHSYFHG